MKPDLSVVVASTWSAGATATAIAAILRSARSAGGWMELIVAADPARVGPIASMPTDVVRVDGRPGDEAPRLRRLGLDRARGDLVAFVEDGAIVAEGWVAALLQAFAIAPGSLAATGPVLRGPGGTSLDRAVDLAEYGPFRLTGGCWAAPGRLAGPNFAMIRRAIPAGIEVRESEWSAEFVAIEAAAVVHVRRYAVLEAIGDRSRFGRTFGCERWDGSRPPRLARWPGIVAPAILAMQLGGLAKSVAVRRGERFANLAALPWAVILLMGWSMGEASGWRRAWSRRGAAAGRPGGQSPDRLGSRRRRYRPGRVDA